LCGVALNSAIHDLKNTAKYDIMNAKAFIINYFNALADTQITDLLPAYRAIIS